MILLLAQNLLLLASGFGLYFLWRAAAPPERWLRWIVAAGFAARALAGQALFWISWARLPILRSLQTADGYWVFALDSTFYFPQAAAAAEKGWRAILSYDRGSASVTYVQLLAGTIVLLGRLISAGILLNLFCYLGTIALLVRWRRVQPQTRTMAAVAIAAISLTPSLVLWSLQPLKDSLFQLLFVAFVAACAIWQRVWLANGSWVERFLAGATLAVVLYLVAGIRWYFAGALVAAATVFLFVVALAVEKRRTFAFAGAVVMIVVLTQSLVASAGAYLPPPLAALLTMKRPRALVQVPHAMFAAIEQVRTGFDNTPASTMIRSGEGRTLAGATSPVAKSPNAPFVPPPDLPAGDARAIRTLLEQQAAAWNRFDDARAMDAYWRSPQLEVVNGGKVIHGWEQTAEDHRRGRGSVTNLRMADLQLAGAGDTAYVRGRWEFTRDGLSQVSTFTMTMRRFPDGQWKIVREVYRPTSPTPPRPAHLTRLVVGAAALVVPRSLGERLGLFDISGGRGMLWFTEIDTLIFDLALFFAVWAVAASGAASWRRPLLWLVLLTTLIVAAPLAYSVSNFGTLFRLREMIYLGLLLLPITAAGPWLAERPGRSA